MKSTLLLPAILLLGGCLALPKPPPAPEAFLPMVDPAPRALVIDSLSLDIAAAPEHLDHRVPQWRRTDGSIRAYQGFQFAAPPSEMLAFVLADAIERSGATRVVHRTGGAPNRLSIELRAFELRSTESTAAHVAWSLRWTCAELTHSKRIDVKVPITERNTAAVMIAMQQAVTAAVSETLTALTCG